MQIIRHSPIGRAINKILRDNRILDSSIKDDLEEWVSEALEMMQSTHQMIPLESDVEIKNYGGKLPCGIDSIQAVSYNGYRVASGERIGSTIRFDHISSNMDYIQHWQSLPPEEVPNEYHQLGVPYIQKTIGMLKSVSSSKVYSDYYYYVRNGKLETNLPDGTATIYYLGVPLDEDNFPLVPENVFLLEAVNDYVDYKLTRRGDKQGNWQPIWQKFNDQSMPRAIGSIEFPTPERMHSIMIGTLGMLKPDYYSQFEL